MKLFSTKEKLVIEISVKTDQSIGFLPLATANGEDYFLSITQWYKSEELLWFAVG